MLLWAARWPGRSARLSARPAHTFELFRQLGGNFYTDVFRSLGEILGYLIVR